jgi:pyruvate dehydrogenase E1 component
VTDHVQLVPEQIRPWIPESYQTLGTDGFGRSDTRPALRRHFEIDAEFITLHVLKSLSEIGEVGREKLAEAIKVLEIDPEKLDPATA